MEGRSHPRRGPSASVQQDRADGLVRFVGTSMVRVWGADRGAGYPVVLAWHGWSDAGLVYRSLAVALRDRCAVVAPDAPGHGRTRWPLPRRFTVDDLVEPALRVKDALPDLVGGPPGPVVLIGHSMGALVAARVAARRPDGVVHVVLEEPPGREHTPHAVRRVQHRRWLTRLQRLDPATRQQLTGHCHDWSADDLDAWARTKAEVDVPLLIRWNGCGEPLERTLGSLRVPVTLVLGEQDQTQTTARRAARLRRAAAGPLRVVRLPGAGHNPRREAPAEFAAVVVEALAW